MVDIVIYHELQTAMMLTNSNGLDSAQFPYIVAWLAKMGGHACMVEQDRKLNDFLNAYSFSL